MTQHKTKPGGQKGNQNARKHGFFSATLSPDEASRARSITNLEGVDPEVAFVRVKLQSSLQHDPTNRRVLTEASRLLARHYSDRYDLDRTDRVLLKTVIETILENALANSSHTPTGP